MIEGGQDMIDFIIALVMGGIIGWLASIVMRTDAQQGIFLNIIVGCIGSILGRLLLRSEEHTSELQSLMRISYAVFCLKKKTYIQHSDPQCRRGAIYIRSPGEYACKTSQHLRLVISDIGIDH